MSDWRVLLANEFKKRNPQHTIGADLGSVISLSPLSFEMLGGDVILEEGEFKLTRTFAKYLERGDIVREGDLVLIIASESMAEFFVVDLIG